MSEFSKTHSFKWVGDWKWAGLEGFNSERSSHPVTAFSCSLCSGGNLWAFTDTFISETVFYFFSLCAYVCISSRSRSVEGWRQPWVRSLVAVYLVLLRQIYLWLGSSRLASQWAGTVLSPVLGLQVCALSLFFKWVWGLDLRSLGLFEHIIDWTNSLVLTVMCVF